MLQTSYSFITSKEIPKQKSNWTKKKKKKNQIEVSLLIKYTDYDYKENRHFLANDDKNDLLRIQKI